MMYLRAFTTLKKWFKYTVWVLIFLITGAHIVGFLGWTFSTIPPTCHWTYNPNETPDQYAARCHHPALDLVLIPYTLFLNVFTVAVDLVILYLPIRPVWQLNLAKRQKISVLVIFFAGGMYELAHSQWNDKRSSLQSDQRYRRQLTPSWIFCLSILRQKEDRRKCDRISSQFNHVRSPPILLATAIYFPFANPSLIFLSARLSLISLSSAAASRSSNPSCANICRAYCGSPVSPPETRGTAPLVPPYRLSIPSRRDGNGAVDPARRSSSAPPI